MLADNIIFKAIPESLYLYRINNNSVGFLSSKVRIVNHLLCSKNSIKRQLNVSIDDVYHRIILSQFEPPDISRKNIKQAFSEFDSIRLFFIKKNNNIDKKSLKEIQDFVEQRKLFVLTNILVKASLPDKIKIFPILLSYSYLLFRSKTWLNVKLRLAWIIFSRIL
jgi:hypothetical protein